MNIDWSKAPEGATHAFVYQDNFSGWRKAEGNKWFGWSERFGWGTVVPRLEMYIGRDQPLTERERVIQDLVTVMNSAQSSGKTFAQALYDAGYRKFEIVEEDV